ncbi:hypothetical protein ACAN107058_16440 [Paracidovorax anthurii]|uniref:Uncharacterized protein n=1 Tax=Paracidovorax anthurii TaxID=78229 RepID=A0A328ZHX7_9BURK|nr:hypothetical protein AX018_100955 [Paracidovorax anthurii]
MPRGWLGLGPFEGPLTNQPQNVFTISGPSTLSFFDSAPQEPASTVSDRA